MKIFVIGGGGREHSIGLALSHHSNLDLYFAPGNAGTAEIGTNVAISETNCDALCAFSRENAIDLTIVGPEAPLVLGIVDLFQSYSLPIIGPTQEAAQLEGSKHWAKELMREYDIPTADYEVFTHFDDAKHYLISLDEYPVVIKADGLAAGKGVTIASNEKEAVLAIEECFLDKKFDHAGSKVVIEHFLSGQEASVLAFTDGHTILPMVAAQDHKAVFDGDQGPNTGGMGAYSPTPIVTDSVSEKVMTRIFSPLLQAFKDRSILYQGIIYAGLMIDDLGNPSVVEFNVRFGDPETQVVLPRLTTPLLDVFQAILTQKLADISLSWSDDYSVCVVLSSEGYPNDYGTGKIITGLDMIKHLDTVHIVHSGTARDHDHVVSSGGRVLGIVALSSSLETAVLNAYRGVKTIQFDNKYYRRDIAYRALSHSVIS